MVWRNSDLSNRLHSLYIPSATNTKLLSYLLALTGWSAVAPGALHFAHQRASDLEVKQVRLMAYNLFQWLQQWGRCLGEGPLSGNNLDFDMYFVSWEVQSKICNYSCSQVVKRWLFCPVFQKNSSCYVKQKF